MCKSRKEKSLVVTKYILSLGGEAHGRVHEEVQSTRDLAE